MKIKLLAGTIIATLTAFSVMASEPVLTAPAPDTAKLSYAVGMRMGLQLLESGTNVDINTAIQAVQDVLQGHTTMLQQSDLPGILNQARTGHDATDQDRARFSYAGGMRVALLFKNTSIEVDPTVVGQAMQDVVAGKPKMKQSEIGPLFIEAAKYETAKKQLANETSGEAFLAKNAKNPDVKVLPDGLQYQIIQDGTGPIAKPDDLIYIKYRGTFINGVEFDKHPHFLTRIHNGLKGWNDVLPKMKVGSEWKLYVPSDLAFGDRGESFHGVGPDTTVIYDLTLVSIAPPNGNYEVSSGLGHGLDIGATQSDSKTSK
ncbi:MAG TPA: FKBP-type peptidyl-prolyl cis-trans isomerase N-terminal domain-containing protein [Verrucomicrobiae bacterium]|nr:FKBP-type peptidyl-prolyl cis-trans isomerase N-terminal domain-containing protein [Verrucomicrobiae bacterium]